MIIRNCRCTADIGDSSAPVKVQMEKTAAGYWQPVGVVEDITLRAGSRSSASARTQEVR